MIESYYWISHAKRLKPVKKPKRWSERLVVNFEKEIIISFFCIRKLFETHKVSNASKDHKANIFAYTASGKKITNLNHFSIDTLYDLENEKKTKKGKPRLFRRTERKRLQAAKRNISEYIKENRHMKTSLLLTSLKRKLRGHYNYFGVVGNLAGLYVVKSHMMKLLHKWLNRRSGRRSFTWERLKHYLIFNPLPTPVCCAKVAQTTVWW